MKKSGKKKISRRIIKSKRRASEKEEKSKGRGRRRLGIQLLNKEARTKNIDSQLYYDRKVIAAGL